jgi:hypothetical protein
MSHHLRRMLDRGEAHRAAIDRRNEAHDRANRPSVRSQHSLTLDETIALNRCGDDPFAFWREVCARRGLDAATVIGGVGGAFTALPVGHGRHWCWPMALRCRSAPPEEFVR